MKKLSLKPKSSPLRRVVAPMLAGAALISTSACVGEYIGDVDGPRPDGGSDVADAGPTDADGGAADAGPIAIGEPVGEPDVGEPDVGVEPEPNVGEPPEEDAGEPGA